MGKKMYIKCFYKIYYKKKVILVIQWYKGVNFIFEGKIINV